VPVAAYMMSVLQRQYAELGPDFRRRYPDAWLVWEPGPWRPAITEEARDLHDTDPPGQLAAPPSVEDDPICYQLPPAEPGRQLSVGRASTNDVILNDACASRQQLVVEACEAGWKVAVTRGEVLLSGLRLELGSWAALASGDCLRIGDLRLSFFDPPALLERLAARSPAPAPAPTPGPTASPG
jgi:hypothetical protein